MVWSIVSSRSCFCRLCRASPPLAAKNVINLILLLMMSTCTAVSCIVGRGCLLWPVCSLGKTVSLCLLHFVLQGHTCLLLQAIFWLPTLHSSPLWWKGHLFFGVSSRRPCRSSENHSKFSFFSISGWGTELDYCDVEWFALVMNWVHSVVFEITPKGCISDSFVEYDGYSISAKGFSPTVVDTMVIWIKFGHSRPF